MAIKLHIFWWQSAAFARPNGEKFPRMTRTRLINVNFDLLLVLVLPFTCIFQTLFILLRVKRTDRRKEPFTIAIKTNE